MPNKCSQSPVPLTTQEQHRVYAFHIFGISSTTSTLRIAIKRYAYGDLSQKQKVNYRRALTIMIKRCIHNLQTMSCSDAQAATHFINSLIPATDTELHPDDDCFDKEITSGFLRDLARDDARGTSKNWGKLARIYRRGHDALEVVRKQKGLPPYTGGVQNPRPSGRPCGARGAWTRELRLVQMLSDKRQYARGVVREWWNV